ncbi:hypothetical protein NC651_035105 [Populus alba x Populus x berolinensis]|nr:hypothetical protein NC651_035105 [Populus alba x Populus x berolinensis]
MLGHFQELDLIAVVFYISLVDQSSSRPSLVFWATTTGSYSRWVTFKQENKD